MCCEDEEPLELPAPVIEMLARYRQLQRDRGWDWGSEEMPAMFRWARFELLGPVLERLGDDQDWAGAVRSVLSERADPAGIVVVRVDADGRLTSSTGTARPSAAGVTVPVDVIIYSAVAAELTVAGHPVPVTADGAAVQTLDLAGPTFEVVHGDHRLVVEDAVTITDPAELRLVSPACARWSVTDGTGGAWFPEGVPHKWDVRDRPYFHAADVTLTVPAVPLTVRCTRGIEFGVVERLVRPGGTVEADPPRLIDPAAAGWFGGDLHVHLNYSGDLVCAPEDAARMQRGEGLHLMSLVAGNFTGSRIYDRELLESTAGRDLWSAGDTVARAGIEYRNDLLGHVHALGPGGPPRHYHAGHRGADDWPPNRAACEDLRSLGATVGYAHPAWTPFPDDWSTDRFFAAPRSVEARELIADAAAGVVDSIDLISPADDEGAVFLYHRLLSCGLRLAATAGTDVFLSFAHGPGTASNPPGWGRVYAHLGAGPLSVPAFQEAIRAGRTMVTNGPWLTMTVDGAGPGAVLDRARGDRLTVQVACTGDAEVTLAGPDGVLATGPGTHTVAVERPMWIAAVARGPGDDRVLDKSAFAHTSAVYVDVAGRRVAREADARWCLDYLDTLEAFVGEHGQFSTRGQRADLDAVLDEARTFYRRVLRSAAI